MQQTETAQLFVDCHGMHTRVQRTYTPSTQPYDIVHAVNITIDEKMRGRE